MDKLTLQELKDIEFDLLKVFDTFCSENNIRYFLAYGTLLGAIRYKGFIPWDDDVDVLVPREDYDRLISIFKDTEEYELASFEKNPKYRFPFAKLCDKSTLKDEINVNNGVQLGVNIDIFPLDNWDDDIVKAKQEANYLSTNISRLGLSKFRKLNTISNPIKQLYRVALFVYCKIRGSKHFIKNIIRTATKYQQKSSQYVGAKAWSVYGERAIIPARAFSDKVYIEFEGEMFPAPVGYDEFLTITYGDYLPEPPKEKQKTHHTFDAYRIDRSDK